MHGETIKFDFICF